jgi:hypothetical protein
MVTPRFKLFGALGEYAKSNLGVLSYILTDIAPLLAQGVLRAFNLKIFRTNCPVPIYEFDGVYDHRVRTRPPPFLFAWRRQVEII